jgi:hypothetical protein
MHGSFPFQLSNFLPEVYLFFACTALARCKQKAMAWKSTTRIHVLVLDLGTPYPRSRPNLPAVLTAHNAHGPHPFTCPAVCLHRYIPIS